MSISVHMISVPAEEVVSSRVTYLPESGGSLGRSPSCDIALLGSPTRRTDDKGGSYPTVGECRLSRSQ